MTDRGKNKPTKPDSEIELALMLEKAILSSPNRQRLSDQGLAELRKALHRIDNEFASASTSDGESPSISSDEVVNGESDAGGSCENIEVQSLHTGARPQNGPIADLLRTVSDWHRWVKSELENIAGSFGSPTVARANSGRSKSRPGVSSSIYGVAADRIWKQEGMVLTLRSSGKRDFIVTLQIKDDAPRKPLRLLWIDEKSLHGQPSEPPKFIEFPIEHQDDGSYRVVIPPKIYGTRMRAIIAAENQRDDEKIDARLLLPFVEMD